MTEIRKIELEIRFTPYTIDTYSTFDMNEECLIEDGKTYDNYEWEYDHKGYVQALAENWQQLMSDNILDGVICRVELDGKAYSPREYNFTTDNCAVIFHVNMERLQAYITEHREQYEKEKIRSRDGFMWFGDDEQTMLHWYLKAVSATKYTEEAYMLDQHDGVSVYEYITQTEIVETV